MMIAEKPLISVVMGIYNCETTLSRALVSVLTQTYSNFECIMCDDGSIDKTYEIARQYAEKDKRFILIKNEKNEGLSFTLNKCIKQARGVFFARMDGDDECLPERFEKQIHFLLENPEFALCGSSVLLFDDQGVWGERPYPEFPQKKSFLFGSPFAHPTILFNRKRIPDLVYETKKKIGRSEDYYLFMQLYAQNLRGYNFPEPLFKYYEAHSSFRKRKLKYVFTETNVRIHGFYKLGILFPTGWLYVLKPIIIALIPKKLQIVLRKHFYNKKNNYLRKIL